MGRRGDYPRRPFSCWRQHRCSQANIGPKLYDQKRMISWQMFGVSWPKAAAVEMSTLHLVNWFKNRRLFGPIVHIPPAAAEANY